MIKELLYRGVCLIFMDESSSSFQHYLKGMVRVASSPGSPIFSTHARPSVRCISYLLHAKQHQASYSAMKWSNHKNAEYTQLRNVQ